MFFKVKLIYKKIAYNFEGSAFRIPKRSDLLLVLNMRICKTLKFQRTENMSSMMFSTVNDEKLRTEKIRKR